jgi:hypothetical protein
MSDSVEIKHTQSKMERKMKTQYSSWPLKHNPLDCLQYDCHQALRRKWAKSWTPSLTMSRGVYMLTYQMLWKEEQGLSLTDVDMWSTSCPVNGKKILKKFKTHVVAMNFNRATHFRQAFTKSEWWRRFLFKDSKICSVMIASMTTH